MLAHVQKLIETGEYVRRIAPREWDEFLAAVDGYVEQSMYNMVNASSEMLPQEQGRAQAAADIRKILREAPEVMRKIEEGKARSR